MSLRGYKQHDNQWTCQNGTTTKLTLDEIAKELNTSKRNLQRALRIERNLTDSMKELLDSGEISKTLAADTRCFRYQIMANIITNKIETVTSMEVAEMIEKAHKELLRDIRRYCDQLDESNIALVDFFKTSTYLDAKGEERPCYLVTKKGCEFIAHKLTGIKGTEFTAKYINRFHYKGFT